MNDFRESFAQNGRAIIEELRLVQEHLDLLEAEAFCKLFASDRNVFLAGAGRSGLVVRTFAMRLMHLGIRAHIPGDIVTPPIRAEDLLVVASGSGETSSLVALATKAKDQGAKIAMVGANPKSSLGRMADSAVILSAPTPKGLGDTAVPHSRQPMGSLFEQSAFLFFETVVLELMRSRGQDSGQMFLRHANLE